jgi:hypothetical protein
MSLINLRKILPDADPGLVARFYAYHEANPDVFIQFWNLAEEIKLAGREKYSAWTIIQRIRWGHDVQAQNEPFKINNDFIALYARFLIHVAPQFEGFFDLRSMKPCDRRASSEERYRKQA